MAASSSYVPFHTYIRRAKAGSGQVPRKLTKGLELLELDGVIYVPSTVDGSRVNLMDFGASGGTLPVISGLTVAERMVGGLHRTAFTLTAVPLTLLDATNGLGTKIFDFPAGAITILSAAGQVAETTTSVLASTLNTGITYNWGVGTVTQANGTLATTEQDIIPTTNGVASATINVAGAISKGTRTAAPAVFDGHSAAKSLFFNVGIATATDIDADATTLWTGFIHIYWINNVGSV